MKNITESVDETTPPLVPEQVRSTRPDEPVIELRRRTLQKVIEAITAGGGGLRMADNVPREELYERARARSEAPAIEPAGI